MLEKDFQKWIIDVAETHHWKIWHVPTPMRPIGNKRFVPDSRGRGLPDLLLIHDDPPRMILAEIKKHDGVISDEQAECLRLARAVAQEIRERIATNDQSFLINNPAPLQVHLWRPENSEMIEAILRGAPA